MTDAIFPHRDNRNGQGNHNTHMRTQKQLTHFVFTDSFRIGLTR